MTASGAGGRLLTLLDTRAPYPLRLKSTIGGTSINAEGVVYGIAALNAVDVRFEIAGKSLAALSDPLHIVLPQTGPYRLAGRLEQHAGVWEFRRFRGTTGRSDLSGDFSVDVTGVRPVLRGDLRSSLLDIADLGGFVGADPGFGLDKPTLSLRAGTALLLGVVNPLAALLPLIETGPGKDSNCAQLAASLTATGRQAGAAASVPHPGRKRSSSPKA
ncbi:MAG: hypothetical protein HY525_13155 [Betaproteobacteria bacterium]|nr:hypothetical protein [Betaproteobacteria bacterium]